MNNSANPIDIIFARVVECRSAEERAAYLDEACGGDATLRERVESLLRAHDAAGTFMNPANPSSAPEPEPESEPEQPQTLDDALRIRYGKPESDAQRRPQVAQPEQPGASIGPYKLLQQIGEGGFGVVYMADQVSPVKRRVALKVIKLGMDTRAVIARFEAERQALAMMDHPNIARVLDAGATTGGRPYFVMELVKGIPITEYCDQATLDTRQRLGLFIDVCRAVQHAHQKGVIHRDLKPSNIMVTLHDDKPVVKVIDFGIAKATDQSLTEKTLFTNYGQMIGTPAYMSPEQAVMSGLDVDTRSDIYSLGVLLYELLTGAPPFDAQTLRKAGFDEMRRIIREQQPPKPSTRLSTMAEDVKLTVANHRRVSPQLLHKQLHGDLDWIVLKAMEKDRARRYETANGLAADLQRHLDKEPVAARPPSAVYRIQKAMQRNKLAFAAGAAIAAALLIGIAASVWQAVRADREAKRAHTAEQQAVATLGELRASAPAFAAEARALAAREQFDAAIEKLDYAIKLRPDVPEYFAAKGDLLQAQLKLAAAAAAYRQALHLKPDQPRAQASATLCDELLAAPLTDQGKLTRETLAKLHAAMQKQQLPAAELLPVARLLGEEKKALLDYWLARLKDLPLPAERPLKDRLTLRDDGRLALDLGDTKITDLAPLAGMPLGALRLTNSRELANFATLAEFRSLESLDLQGTAISDLAPLSGLPLDTLSLRGTRIFDLSALRGMNLKSLNLRDTRVADLSALAGMPLTSLDATSIPAADYSPLAGAPLEKCIIQNSPLRDLSFLRNAPVKELVLFGCSQARGFAVLASLKSLDLLILPETFRNLPEEELAAIGALHSHPTLRNIQGDTREGGGYWINTAQSKEEFWKDWDVEQSFVPALRKSGINFYLNKLPDKTFELDINRQPVTDLSFLKGAPISRLIVVSCKFSDLAALGDMPLEYLNVPDNPIADLSPLRGNRKIKTLYLTHTKVSDLSPLTSLPLLKELYLGDCGNVSDVAVLARIPTLEKVVVPMNARNIEALRNLPNLQKLSYSLNNAEPFIPDNTAQEFWKEFDAGNWISRLRQSGLTARSLQRSADGTWNVDLSGTAITDLAILRGASIGTLSLAGTGVSDLRPLGGMPLQRLVLSGTRVTDLGPLQGIRIYELDLSGTKVADLSKLRGMPLARLWLHDCEQFTDLSSLPDLKDLNSITLPWNAKHPEALRDAARFPKLARIGFSPDPKTRNADQTAAEFWKELDQRGWRTALRESGLKPNWMKRSVDGTWDLNLDNTAISDLTILRGAPISVLSLGGTAVADLEPLRGMPLKELVLWNTRVSNLSPLEGMRLEYLWLNGIPVSDLSPLRAMPLAKLKLKSCAQVTDLSPLADAKELIQLILPPNPKDIDFLRNLPKLKLLSFEEDPARNWQPDKTTAEFWKEYESQKNGTDGK
jgi:serine/threonine protein kinase/Leucine-rich repeat (LRR) protein